MSIGETIPLDTLKKLRKIGKDKPITKKDMKIGMMTGEDPNEIEEEADAHLEELIEQREEQSPKQ